MSNAKAEQLLVHTKAIIYRYILLAIYRKRERRYEKDSIFYLSYVHRRSH